MTRKDNQTYVNSYLRYLKRYGKKHVNKGLTDNEFGSLALRRYHLHNQMIREYFKDRPNDLLEIKVGVKNAGQDEWDPIIKFLGCNKPAKGFPHENKSNNKGRGRHQTPNNPVIVNEKDDKWNW
eukprot:259909_1